MKMINIPFRICISGPSLSGKSYFACQFIKNLKRFTGKDFNIIWCLANESSVPYNLPSYVTVNFGCPDLSALPKSTEKRPLLIILDDLSYEYGDKFCSLFTRRSHHENISLIIITQNFFQKTKGFREITLNCSCLVLTRNLRDRSQIYHLARQLSPKNPQKIVDAYEQSTQKEFSHFFIDLDQKTNNLLRYKSNIFDKYPIVYTELPTNEEVYFLPR